MLFLLAFICLALVDSSSASTSSDPLAPLAGMNNPERHPNEYIVVLRDGYTVEEHFRAIGRNLSSSAHFCRYSFGYQATIDDETRDELVRHDPGVKLVEANFPIHAIMPDDITSADPSELPHVRKPPRMKRNYRTAHQEDAPYGLQMLTTASSKLDVPIQDGGTYDYLENAGRGVQVYVMDSGIRTTHHLFGGRARHFGGLGPDDLSPYTGQKMRDVRGHGTMVAGVIAAEQYGVAPHASIISVKVLLDNGTVSRDAGPIREAIQDIIAEHNKNKRDSANSKDPWKFRGSVINMSFGWVAQGGLFIVDTLIEANEAGISIFAAAGNHNIQSDYNPCILPEAECIAAVDNTYHKWKASNYGNRIDFVAPGKDILSTFHKSDISVSKASGTSLACPHAAGAAAIFASWKGLVSRKDLSHSLVWWNSRAGLVTGFPSGTQTFLVNTGIYDPQKFPHEPFRWAFDNPAENDAEPAAHEVVADATVQFAPPSVSENFITLYTDSATVTLEAVAGLITATKSIGDIDSYVFEASTHTPTPTSPPTGPVCASSGTAFAQPPAQSLISVFCSEPQLDEEFVPYIAFGNGSTQLGEPKTLQAEGKYNLDGTPNVLWMRIRFSHGSCMGSFNGTYLCNERLSTILNGCDTNTIDAKLGGTLDVGCASYALTVVDSHTDPFQDREFPTGNFTCKDTKTVPPDNTFQNTCTCWMSLLPSQTAIFEKPSNGRCDGSSVDMKNGLVANQGY